MSSSTLTSKHKIIMREIYAILQNQWNEWSSKRTKVSMLKQCR
jgi:hypothetical protein